MREGGGTIAFQWINCDTTELTEDVFDVCCVVYLVMSEEWKGKTKTRGGGGASKYRLYRPLKNFSVGREETVGNTYFFDENTMHLPREWRWRRSRESGRGAWQGI